MNAAPDAIGYLRKDISGIHQRWDEIQMRSLAQRLGYNLRKTITFDTHTVHPVYRLGIVATRLEVDAVFVPSAAHFDGRIPADLVAIADVITVSPEATYARWGNGELPELNGV
ncbi:hypothetical protein [Nocardia mexicana]|uniref:Uncharacterized protein n=1 Tax=Nocardia mexicana TaxID=279262 RepID=A0A370H3X8_9NOCA|nr:hypothetical protein [Nocardia mexicana]RDI50896.1 hypothetical protein DFR68_105373 [Nocardia mexicana]